MDDLPLSWYNLHDQDNHQEEIFDFDSENMFLYQIQHFPPSNWEDQATAADLVCSNGFQEIKNVISVSTTKAAATTVESLECLLSGTNSSTDVSNGISVIFSDCKSLWRNNIFAGNKAEAKERLPGNNNISGVSSGNSLTDDGAVSQCSSGKWPIGSVYRVSDKPPKQKRSRSNTGRPTTSNINFQQPGNPSETDMEAIAQMKEMIYREAAFRPVSFVAEIVDKPKRKNVRISNDPQTVAARQRRERISERIRILQKLVPGGNKMDTASMLDEAANYLKFLRSQVKALEQVGQNSSTINANATSPIIHHASLVVPFTQNSFPMQTHFQLPHENSYPNPPAAAQANAGREENSATINAGGTSLRSTCNNPHAVFSKKNNPHAVINSTHNPFFHA